MKIAVYTCITGAYDPVHVPLGVDPRVDYLLFTDQPEQSVPPWMPQPFGLPRLDAKDRSRYPKICPHRIPALAGYDLTIYVDGSIAIVGDIMEFAGGCLNRSGEFFAFEHLFRDCIYDEASECALLGHAGIFRIAGQMRRYRRSGYPPKAGLFEASVLVRRRSPAVDRAMDLWWAEYRDGAKRDQLSLTYAAWRSGLAIASLGASDPRVHHRYFRLEAHRASSESALTRFWRRFNRLALRWRWLDPRR